MMLMKPTEQILTLLVLVLALSNLHFIYFYKLSQNNEAIGNNYYEIRYQEVGAASPTESIFGQDRYQIPQTNLSLLIPEGFDLSKDFGDGLLAEMRNSDGVVISLVDFEQNTDNLAFLGQVDYDVTNREWKIDCEAECNSRAENVVATANEHPDRLLYYSGGDAGTLFSTGLVPQSDGLGMIRIDVSYAAENDFDPEDLFGSIQ